MVEAEPANGVRGSNEAQQEPNCWRVDGHDRGESPRPQHEDWDQQRKATREPRQAEVSSELGVIFCHPVRRH